MNLRTNCGKMNVLTKIRVFSRFPCIYRTFASEGKEVESPWYRDNAPGPYPKTEEEKCAAAKKYNLLREEYEPYPDDGDGFGDYPKLPAVNVEQKDPYLLWTDRYFRRNLGEPLPIHFLVTIPGRVKHYRKRHSFLYYMLYFLSFPSILALIMYYFGDYKIYRDVMEKQMYKPGVTHYTFDLDDKDMQIHN